jgi:aminoglycoside 6-adenylyltransferase
MNGSRTNPNVKKDIFQDYDVVYVVTETASFLQDKNWTRVFGEMLIIQYPDELNKIGGGKPDFNRDYGYLMQFADGNRIDLSIKTLDLVLEEYTADKLTIPLLDKDNVLPAIPAPSDIDYWVKKPSADLYYRCCNEFYWVLLYIGKGLWRDEILYALDCMNYWVRPQLLEMLSWHAGIQTDFSCSMGKSGKYLKDYLPPDLWNRYLLTYPKADIPAVWEASFIMTELFEEIAVKVGKEFGYVYNYNEAKRCTDFMKHIYSLVLIWGGRLTFKWKSRLIGSNKCIKRIGLIYKLRCKPKKMNWRSRRLLVKKRLRESMKLKNRAVQRAVLASKMDPNPGNPGKTNAIH